MSAKSGFPRTLRFYRHRTNELLDCAVISLPKLDRRKPWGNPPTPRLMFKISWDSHKYEKDITFAELLIANSEVFGTSEAGASGIMLRHSLPPYFTLQTCEKFQSALQTEFKMVEAIRASGGAAHDQYTHLAIEALDSGRAKPKVCPH
jgi:hypothetical protein